MVWWDPLLWAPDYGSVAAVKDTRCKEKGDLDPMILQEHAMVPGRFPIRPQH